MALLRTPKTTPWLAGDLRPMSEGVADRIRSAGKGHIMAKPLLQDELWELIEPLIPPHPPQPKGGRPSLDDRKVLTGIIFLLLELSAYKNQLG